MITFYKDLLPINPAYNNSIIQFSSDTISGATKAVITIGGKEFLCVPLNGLFTFNFKDVIKNIINSNRFDDALTPDLSDGIFVQSDPNVLKSVAVNIKVHNFTNNEQVDRTYTFIRGVEQVLGFKPAIENAVDVKVLLPTKNNIDYYTTFFEGYPFDIAIFGLNSGDTFVIKNITSNNITPAVVSDNNNVKRFYFSDGANNTTDTNILPMPSTLNKLELYVNDAFKANIFVRKKEGDCGVYIKWLNSRGTYSYWKFDGLYKATVSSKTTDDFNGSYDNIQNISSDQYVFGKTAGETMSINTLYEGVEAEYLKDLLISPNVQMYIHHHPFIKQGPSDFVGIKINDASFSHDNKLGKGKFSITISLPTINTITQ